MAKRFVLTAALNITGPFHLNEVINKMKRAVGEVRGSIKLDFSQRINQNLTNINKRLDLLRKRLDEIPARATTAAQAMERLGTAFGVANAPIKDTLVGFRKVQQAASKQRAAVKQTGDQLEIFATQAATATRRFLAFAIPASILFRLAFAAQSAAREALNFQDQMVRISQVSGKSVSQLAGLEREITHLSTTLGVSSSSLIEVSQTLFQAGLASNDVKKALDKLAQTAVAPTFTDIGKTTEALIAIMGQFNVSADTAASKFGIINQLAAKFAVEADDITAAVRKAGGVFASAGGSFEEFASILTAVRSTTRESADTIGTAMKTIFQTLQRPKVIDKLERLTNIKIVDGNQLKEPIKLFTELSRVIQDLPAGDIRVAEIAETIGGLRQVGKTIAILRNVSLAKKAFDQTVIGGSSLIKDAEISQQSLLRQTIRVREEFLALFRSIITDKSFQIFAKNVLQLTTQLIKLADAFKPLIPLIGAFFGVKLLSGSVKFGKTFFPKFKNATATAGDQFTAGSISSVLRAKGGKIPGTGNTDSVAALLTPGEFVINRDSARKIGLDRLIELNRFAKGGPVRRKRRSDLPGIFVRAQSSDDLDFADLTDAEKIARQAVGRPSRPSVPKQRIAPRSGKKTILNLSGEEIPLQSNILQENRQHLDSLKQIVRNSQRISDLTEESYNLETKAGEQRRLALRGANAANKRRKEAQNLPIATFDTGIIPLRRASTVPPTSGSRDDRLAQVLHPTIGGATGGVNVSDRTRPTGLGFAEDPDPSETRRRVADRIFAARANGPAQSNSGNVRSRSARDIQDITKAGKATGSINSAQRSALTRIITELRKVNPQKANATVKVLNSLVKSTEAFKLTGLPNPTNIIPFQSTPASLPHIAGRIDNGIPRGSRDIAQRQLENRTIDSNITNSNIYPFAKEFDRKANTEAILRQARIGDTGRTINLPSPQRTSKTAKGLAFTPEMIRREQRRAKQRRTPIRFAPELSGPLPRLEPSVARAQHLEAEVAKAIQTGNFGGLNQFNQAGPGIGVPKLQPLGGTGTRGRGFNRRLREENIRSAGRGALLDSIRSPIRRQTAKHRENLVNLGFLPGGFTPKTPVAKRFLKHFPDKDASIGRRTPIITTGRGLSGEEITTSSRRRTLGRGFSREARAAFIRSRQVQRSKQIVTPTGIETIDTSLGGRGDLLDQTRANRRAERGRFARAASFATRKILPQRAAAGLEAFAGRVSSSKPGKVLSTVTRKGLPRAALGLGAAALATNAIEPTSRFKAGAQGALAGGAAGFFLGGGANPVGITAGLTAAIVGATTSVISFDKALSDNKIEAALERQSRGIEDFLQVVNDQKSTIQDVDAQFELRLNDFARTRETTREENPLTGGFLGLSIEKNTKERNKKLFAAEVGAADQQEQVAVALGQGLIDRGQFKSRKQFEETLASQTGEGRNTNLTKAFRTFIAARLNPIDQQIQQEQDRLATEKDPDKIKGINDQIGRLRKIREKFGQGDLEIGAGIDSNRIRGTTAAFKEFADAFNFLGSEMGDVLDKITKATITYNTALSASAAIGTKLVKAAQEYEIYAKSISDSNDVLLGLTSGGPANISVNSLSAGLELPGTASSLKSINAITGLIPELKFAGDSLKDLGVIGNVLEASLPSATTTAQRVFESRDPALIAKDNLPGSRDKDAFDAFKLDLGTILDTSATRGIISDDIAQLIQNRADKLEPSAGDTGFQEFLQKSLPDQIKELVPEVANADLIGEQFKQIAAVLEQRGNRLLEGLGTFQQLITQENDIRSKSIDLAERTLFFEAEQKAQFEGRRVSPEQIAGIGNEAFLERQRGLVGNQIGDIIGAKKDANGNLLLDKGGNIQFERFGQRDLKDPTALRKLAEEKNTEADLARKRFEDSGLQDKGAAEEFRQLEREAQDAGRALANLADRTDNTAAALSKLESIQGDVQGRFGFAENFISQDRAGQREILKDRLAAKRAIAQGNLNLKATDRIRAVRFLRGNENVVENGKTLGETLRELIANTKGVPGLPGPDQQQQFNDALGQYRDAIKENLRAQEDQQELLRNQQQKFVDNLERQFNNLDQILAKIPKTIDLTGNHKVQIIINGAEVLQKLHPEIVQLIKSEAKGIVNRNLQANFKGQNIVAVP